MTSYARVSDLVAGGMLRVEDGNHGEYRPRPHEFVTEGVPFIRAADMTSGVVDFNSAGKIDATARARIRKGVGRPGDVLLSHKGTVGKVAVAPMDAPDYVCSPQTTFWRSLDGERLEQRFLPYVLQSPGFVGQLSFLMGQTDMAPYVSLTDQRSMMIPVPSINQQRAIAEVLGTLDDKIAANAALVANAEELMRTIVGRSPDETSVSSLANQRTAQLRPEGFSDRVSHYSLPAFDDGARAELVRGDSIKSSKFLLREPCVLVSKLNPRIPRLWSVPLRPIQMALASTEFVVLEPESVDVSELWAALAQPSVWTTLTGKVAGTSGSHQRVKPAEIMALTLKDPRALPSEMRHVLRSLGLRCESARAEGEHLATTRDALLPGLMSGTIQVQDAERVVERVV